MSLFHGKKQSYKDKKSLVIYFSRADENYFGGTLKYIEKGNTEVIAEYIRDITGADLFKVERKTPYNADYKICLEESRQEIKNNERPELSHYIDNIDEYEVIYIGGPVYLGVLPSPMVTQLEKLDFTGKIVRPFTTHEGSGLGSVPYQVKKICKGAVMTEGLSILGSSVYNAKEKVENWV